MEVVDFEIHDNLPSSDSKFDMELLEPREQDPEPSVPLAWQPFIESQIILLTQMEELQSDSESSEVDLEDAPEANGLESEESLADASFGSSTAAGAAESVLADLSTFETIVSRRQEQPDEFDSDDEESDESDEDSSVSAPAPAPLTRVDLASLENLSESLDPNLNSELAAEKDLVIKLNQAISKAPFALPEGLKGKPILSFTSYIAKYPINRQAFMLRYSPCDFVFGIPENFDIEHAAPFCLDLETYFTEGMRDERGIPDFAHFEARGYVTHLKTRGVKTSLHRQLAGLFMYRYKLIESILRGRIHDFISHVIQRKTSFANENRRALYLEDYACSRLTLCNVYSLEHLSLFNCKTGLVNANPVYFIDFKEPEFETGKRGRKPGKRKTAPEQNVIEKMFQPKRIKVDESTETYFKRNAKISVTAGAVIASESLNILPTLEKIDALRSIVDNVKDSTREVEDLRRHLENYIEHSRKCKAAMAAIKRIMNK